MTLFNNYKISKALRQYDLTTEDIDDSPVEFSEQFENKMSKLIKKQKRMQHVASALGSIASIAAVVLFLNFGVRCLVNPLNADPYLPLNSPNETGFIDGEPGIQNDSEVFLPAIDNEEDAEPTSGIRLIGEEPEQDYQVEGFIDFEALAERIESLQNSENNPVYIEYGSIEELVAGLDLSGVFPILDPTQLFPGNYLLDHPDFFIIDNIVVKMIDGIMESIQMCIYNPMIGEYIFFNQLYAGGIFSGINTDGMYINPAIFSNETYKSPYDSYDFENGGHQIMTFRPILNQGPDLGEDTLAPENSQYWNETLIKIGEYSGLDEYHNNDGFYEQDYIIRWIESGIYYSLVSVLEDTMQMQSETVKIAMLLANINEPKRVYLNTNHDGYGISDNRDEGGEPGIPNGDEIPDIYVINGIDNIYDLFTDNANSKILEDMDIMAIKGPSDIIGKDIQNEYLQELLTKDYIAGRDIYLGYLHGTKDLYISVDYASWEEAAEVAAFPLLIPYNDSFGANFTHITVTFMEKDNFVGNYISVYYGIPSGPYFYFSQQYEENWLINDNQEDDISYEPILINGKEGVNVITPTGNQNNIAWQEGDILYSLLSDPFYDLDALIQIAENLEPLS